MKNEKNKPITIEDEYKRYFVPINHDNETTSLRQPSLLRSVQSFTTYGITDDLFLHRSVKQNA